MQIGRGPRKPPEDVVELLLACHERIRRFSDMACALAEAGTLDEEEIVRAAGEVARYFGEALPLHVRDEEESVLPRLRGMRAELDAALARMADEHGAHEPSCARLIELCAALRDAPERRAALAPELAALAQRLRAELAEHLEEEERVILPAVAELDDAERRAMLAELRARRTR